MGPSQDAPLKEPEAARYIGMSTQWLRISRMRGAKIDAPPYLKIGKAVRYLRGDLDTWLESRRHVPGKAA